MTKSLKKYSYSLCFLGFVVVVTSILFGGLNPFISLLQFVVFVTIALSGILGAREQPSLKYLSMCILIGLFITVACALTGFYAKDQIASYDTGGTWVSSHSIGNAVAATILDPASFVAAMFGYDCNGLWGNNCSSVPYYAGIGVIEAILFGSAITGVVLVAENSKLKSTTEATRITS